ncbi:hypothetical protein FGO68_gene2776 [Halteria grandinella]|uniref:Uncharacterized protein n=1 Tax=Halteria grandinella TaxID=5974 RepID=A0A8J8T8T0_HALGN|nr:hypothetical protein FGO68_gene2776 [Halteria grandinella]
MRLSNAKVPNEIKVYPDTQSKVKFAADQKEVQIQIKEISCGAQHSAFLTFDGDIYVCGNGERGQLGIGIATIKEYKPLKVKLTDENGKPHLLTPKFKQVTCGQWHTGMLTESGVIYVTGDNQQFQLGMELEPSKSETLSNDKDMAIAPLALDIQSDKPLQIRKLHFGVFSSALTFSGEIFVWGIPPYKFPTFLKAQQQHSSLDQNSINKVTIPITLFRDIKLSNDLLVSADVDNNLWRWSADDIELLPCGHQGLLTSFSGRMKDYFVDYSSKELILLTAEERKSELQTTSNGQSLDQMSGQQLRSILKQQTREKSNENRDSTVSPTPQRKRTGRFQDASTIKEESVFGDKPPLNSKKPRVVKSLPQIRKQLKNKKASGDHPRAIRKALNSCSSSSPSRSKSSSPEILSKMHPLRRKNRQTSGSKSIHSQLDDLSAYKRVAYLQRETTNESPTPCKREESHQRRSGGKKRMRSQGYNYNAETKTSIGAHHASQNSYTRSNIRVAARDYYKSHLAHIESNDISPRQEQSPPEIRASSLPDQYSSSRATVHQRKSSQTMHPLDSQVRSLNRDLNSQHQTSCLASQRQSYVPPGLSTTAEYLNRLTQENQQLKLQIAEKRLIQSEELNAKLLEENEVLREKLDQCGQLEEAKKQNHVRENSWANTVAPPSLRRCERCTHVEAQLKETQQTLERSQQNSDRKKENVLNKMGDLAEKYHLEKEKNRTLVLELQRMNETLARFEQRINALLKEKKSLASDLEQIKEKYDLSKKLRGSTEERRDLSNIREQLNQQQQSYVNPNVMSEPDCRSQYSNFVKDMLSNTKQIDFKGTGAFQEVQEAETTKRVEKQLNKVLDDSPAKLREHSKSLERQNYGKAKSRSETQNLPSHVVQSREQPIDQSRDYYNSHILRSLERYAQKTVEEKKKLSDEGGDHQSSKISSHHQSQKAKIKDMRRQSENLMREDIENQLSAMGKSDSEKTLQNPPSYHHAQSRQIRQPFQEILNSKSANTGSNVSRHHNLGSQGSNNQHVKTHSSYMSQAKDERESIGSIQDAQKSRREELKRQMSEFQNRLRGNSQDGRSQISQHE